MYVRREGCVPLIVVLISHGREHRRPAAVSRRTTCSLHSERLHVVQEVCTFI